MEAGKESSVVELEEAVATTSNSPIALFDFLPDNGELCLVYRSGHVFTKNSSNALEERGCIVGEIHGGAWSPDLQLLVVATEDLLISISCEFDTIAERNCRRSVGARKETQFQGQAGKANREKVDWNRVATQLHKWDEPTHHALVQWRADAQLLATSTVERIERKAAGDADGPRKVVGRRIRVWDRELQLLSCCDILAGIEPVLALKPGKNLILTSRLFSATDLKPVRSLWFFEQNGQYRSDARMPTGSEGIVEKLQWNADGSILLAAVWFEQTKRSQIQFWTVSNAEWALKTAVDFAERVVKCAFSQEISSLCHVLTNGGRFWKLELDRVYTCVDGVAVNELRLSDFNRAPIPPPMSHTSIRLTGEGGKNEFVARFSLSSARRLAAFTSASNLKIYEYNGDKLKFLSSSPLRQLNGGIVHGLQWTTDGRGLTFVHSTDCRHEVISWDKESGQLTSLLVSETPIVFHVLNSTSNALFFVDIFGVCKRKTKSGEIEMLFDSRTRNFASWSLLTTRKNILLGLSPRHELIANGRVLAENCTSFSVTSTEDFVLLTTFSNRLFVVSLDEIERFLDNPTAKPQLGRGDGRLVERGAAIVGHEAGVTAARCWLQMPRGNLEQVFPRDLLIERLKVMIDRRAYRDVLKEMRRHRVNMNLVYDHDPQNFRSNCELFVSQFDPRSSLDVELLQLFVTALEDEDCTCGLFAANYEQKGRREKPADDKVEFVCSRVAAELKRREQEAENPTDFDAIYAVVLTCFVKPKDRSFLSNSLRHLCYIVPEQALFDAALRTYDLDVVSMIADKQQKVGGRKRNRAIVVCRIPREYLPIINELRAKTPKEYQNFSICLLLKDWTAALRHIAAVPDRFDECVEHVKQHQLYSDALAIFVGSEKYTKICELYAEFLHSKAKFGLAAAEEADVLRPTFESGLKKLAVQLEQHDQFEAAAECLEASDSTANADRILQLLIKASAWKKAVEWARRHDRMPDLTATLKSRVGSLNGLLAEWDVQYTKHLKRLLVVRQTKAKQLHDWVEAQGEVDIGQSETMSEASSVLSNVSRMSGMSTASARKRKNVRPKEKKTVIKEGSQYEDSALLLALKTISQSVDGVQDEMLELLPALLVADLIEEARGLQATFGQLLQRCREGARSAWPEFLKPADLPGPLFELYRCEDGVVRMPELDAMPPRIRLEEEMLPPTFRKNVSWKLDLFD
ncbi:Elongator complex protein 1 [Aphelenchoides fujianensis]|nr:Elongator complex protein 1 [Aphelenchoides fujianensis]